MTQFFMMMQFGCSVTPVMNTLMKANTTLAPVQCARTTKQKERAMSKWIVVTEVESEIDPATWSYVNGTTLVSSQLMEEESNG